MVYLKSIVAGLIAVIGTLVLSVIGFIVWGLWMSQRYPNAAGASAVSYDIRAPCDSASDYRRPHLRLRILVAASQGEASRPDLDLRYCRPWR
jgi:hypothetical protein